VSLWDAVFDLALQLWLGSVEDHIFFCAALETIAPEFLTATLHFAIQSLSSRYRPVRGGSGVAGVQELQNKEATLFRQERNSELKEPEASRASRRRAWENLQEVLKETIGITPATGPKDD